ncbi:MAG: FKBP-type peptidyl-prolyl cis-trans isomerase [Patescibacteria group bacterium]|nr:FKBP-type peptidyl-prolyl cis-trans isomerase [Patescibacteria group bacterium]
MDNENNKTNKLSTLGVIAISAFLIIFLLNQNLQTKNNINNKLQSEEKSAVETKTEEENELEIEDLVIGTGKEAQNGKKVSVNYKGTLTNGVQFDNSYDRGRPFTFTLGVGEVIKGWDQGIVGMKVGGKRKLTIPPSLAYGSKNLGTIPPHSTLIFEVELLEVKD